MHAIRSAVVIGIMLCGAGVRAGDANRPGEPHSVESVSWLSDYHAAMDRAASAHRMVFLWLYDPQHLAGNDRFETEVLQQSQIASRLAECVCARLPVDARIESQGKTIELLAHEAFRELHQLPGLAMIDMTDPESPHFRQVVSVYPFAGEPIPADKLDVLLDLPRASLTQRTLIFAVRTHVERPASAGSELSGVLLRETESHALNQANILLQGHHAWESRFHAINAELGGGLVAREVCAESWPGQGLIEAAEECVDSWRQSPGHWGAVSRRHTLFAYDMKRGRNGVWYAVGIFAGQP